MATTKAYLIGYEPPGLTQSRVERTRLMQACDFCIAREEPCDAGEEITVAGFAFLGNGSGPPEGARFRVLATESLGKVVLLERLPHV